MGSQLGQAPCEARCAPLHTTTNCRDSWRVYDAGNKIKDRKRRILTDTEGNLVHALIHTADIQDRDGAPLLLAEIIYRFP